MTSEAIPTPETTAQAQPPAQCWLAQQRVGREALADVEYYPYTLVCEDRNCDLLGVDLNATYGVGLVHVEVNQDTQNRSTPDGCPRETDIPYYQP